MQDVAIHKHHRKLFIKFILLCLVMVGYFAYLTYQYDILTGGVASLLTWTFFVLCTPVADAGFLLDFPIRLLFGVRMMHSELIVWSIAIVSNVLALQFANHYYETTLLTKLLHDILLNPYPYWVVILLSAAGTFLSLKFGDEVMDVVHKHRDVNKESNDYMVYLSHHLKYEAVLVLFFIAVLFGYYELVLSLGISDKIG